MATENNKLSAKQRFMSTIEQKILSGELAVNQKLPPERELSEKADVSRVTVHAAIIELASKNVLRVVPRQGTYVNDFKNEGTLELYGALMKYTGEMDADIFRSLIEFREIVETAAAAKAAVNRTEQHMQRMRKLLSRERGAETADEAAKLIFQMHLEIMRASGNIVMQMTLRSIEDMYISLIRRFCASQGERDAVLTYHEKLIDALESSDVQASAGVMKDMLDYGHSEFEMCLSLKND